MPSSEEIDIMIESLGYYVVLDGFIFPDMDNYWILKDYFRKSTPRAGCPVIEKSEADGERYWFDTDDFLSDVDWLIDNRVIETQEMNQFKWFLYRIYMPRYYENKKAKEEERPQTVLDLEWYENGATCSSEIDYPNHLQISIREDGDIVYGFTIDNVSFEVATKIFQNLNCTNDFDHVTFGTIR